MPVDFFLLQVGALPSAHALHDFLILQAMLFWALWLHVDGMLSSISLQPLCCNDTYGMIGGCTEGGDVGWGENVKTLCLWCPSTALMSGYINLHLLLQCLVFKQTFKSTEPVIHLCVTEWTSPSLTAAPPFLPLHDELVTTLEAWWVEEMCNQQPVKGQDGAAVWPYCSPIKSPQILTDVKVQAEAVGCLLIADKASRNSSLEVIVYFSPVQEGDHLVAVVSALHVVAASPVDWFKGI